LFYSRHARARNPTLLSKSSLSATINQLESSESCLLKSALIEQLSKLGAHILPTVIGINDHPLRQALAFEKIACKQTPTSLLNRAFAAILLFQLL